MNMHIFFTFCTLLLAQAIIIQAKPEPRAAELRDAADVAEKLLEKLIAGIDIALDGANNTLKAAVQTVNATINNLEDKAQDAFNLVLKPINAKMNASVEAAKKLGLNISETCENQIKNLTDLPNSLIANMADCMTDQLDEASGHADDVLSELREVQEKIANYTNKIQECKGKFWTEIKCLALLTAQIAKDNVDVPLKIGTDVAKTTLAIKSVIPKVTICYTTTLAQLPIQGLAIVGKFAKCVGVPQI